MATKRKKNKGNRGAMSPRRGERGAVRGPGRPEKELERVPYSFDHIIRSLVKPVPKEKQETA